jgi:hypothetical protein
MTGVIFATDDPAGSQIQSFFRLLHINSDRLHGLFLKAQARSPALQASRKEVIKMNGSKNFSSRRFLALIALLFGSMVTSMAYGQECDPSWYNPWGAPGAAASQSAQPQAAAHKRQAKVKAVSSTQRAGKVRAKAAAAQTRPS